MRAILRWKTLMAGGLLFVPVAAIAQSTAAPAPSNTPPTDGVGPQELQNFSLSGSVSKPADQQPQPPQNAAPAAVQGDDNDRASSATTVQPIKRREQLRHIAGDVAAPPRQVTAAKAREPLVTATVRPSVPMIPGPQGVGAAPVPTESVPTAAISSTAPSLGADHKLMVWPWLLAALAVAGATMFLFWRRRHQEAFAGGAQFDSFVSPAPAPPIPRRVASPRAAAPVAPQAPQPKPVTPTSNGIVSTRLRPVLEVGVQPLRCVVDDDNVVVEFELELFNSGTAPARAVLAEASLFNAGANQEQELAAFFASPAGAGERLDVIPPMKRVNFINQVTAPRAAIQEYELGGRKVFVPVLAFNALYTWSGGEAQTSVAYLVGRETGGEKLGPLRLDGGPREIVRLAGRALPTAHRT